MALIAIIHRDCYRAAGAALDSHAPAATDLSAHRLTISCSVVSSVVIPLVFAQILHPIFERENRSRKRL